VLVATDRPPKEFKLAVCLRIEARRGPVRDPGDALPPRTIDLELALRDDAVPEVLGSPAPDPDTWRHLHVALPCADLKPDLVNPVDGRTPRGIATGLAAGASQTEVLRPPTGLIGWDLFC
jgi:7,8-dihydro-6-hydroxymethylpterin-pyrophosphokinase